MKEKILQILEDERKHIDPYVADYDYPGGYDDGWNDALIEVGAMILKVCDEQQ